ncbi:hypothetical protein [Halarchaeum nitratireducens]|uniref:Uncharacterized protein n=1 Tax=Halarchaeum nitratireducens TaxID=489913 RepID=A0A830GDA7_9EURY|nr:MULTISPECIES: hypothetical protein [Halarchaeum]MBP2252384.1 transcription elongation factor Elf1 [Halarchaeum solikamskense]GGN20440.1 hypothetical protein GCM10009021_21930 [Halarchaeum nitratireducens]
MGGVERGSDDKRVKGVLRCPHCGAHREDQAAGNIPQTQVDECIPTDEDWSVDLVKTSRTRTIICQSCGKPFKCIWRSLTHW